MNSSRDLTFTLLNRLVAVQERLSGDMGFESEVDNVMALKVWADDVADPVWQVVRKASRLADDVDYLASRLTERQIG